MAIEAQRSLPGAIGAIMAVAAGVFEFGVRLGHLTWHEQALDRGAMGERCADERCCQHDSHDPTTSWQTHSFSSLIEVG